MARNHPAKKLPPAVPPAKGPRAQHAAKLLALEVGGWPLSAPLADRNRIAQLARYWGRTLGRTFVTRRQGDRLRVWRTA